MLELSVYDQLMEQHQKMVEVGFRKGFVESRFEIFIRMINQILKTSKALELCTDETKKNQIREEYDKLLRSTVICFENFEDMYDFCKKYPKLDAKRIASKALLESEYAYFV